MLSKEEIKLRWLVKIRWGAVAAWSVVSVLIWITGILDASPVPILTFLALTAVSNLFLARVQIGKDLLLSFGGGILALDILLLTGLLFCYGGYTNPFSMMFLVYVTIAAFVLNATWTWWSFAGSSLGFMSLFFYHIPLTGFDVHHHGGSAGFNLHLHGMLIAFLVIGALISLFLTQMSREVDAQGEKINQLTERRGIEEKFLAIATLAAGAAHELSTPIGTLALITDDFAAALKDDPRFGEDVLLMQSQISRCTTILERMRGEANRNKTEELLNISAQDLKNYICEVFGSHAVRVSAQPGELLTYGDALKEVLSSLVKNALQASSNGQQVMVDISFDSTSAHFTVSDNGSGMSSAQVHRVGEPFYTTKSPGSGFGLGVFLVKVFAQRVGGDLRIESSLGDGTRVSLQIPRFPADFQEVA